MSVPAFLTAVPSPAAGAPSDSAARCATTPKRVANLPGSSSLRSVGTALDVLECFALDSELGVSDIARRLGVAKSTAHRVLQTLLSRGFIEQDGETGLYRLGIHIYELGTLAHARNGIRHAALPTLRQVASVTGLTVNLAIPDGPDIVFVERIENRDGVRILGNFGRRLPAHTTSSGKVIAAFNASVDQARRTAGFPPRAGRTIRTETDWVKDLDGIRRDGYAVARSESFDGASSIAVPVLERGVAVAGISVFGPSEIIDPKTDALVPVLRAAATRIARSLSGAVV